MHRAALAAYVATHHKLSTRGHRLTTWCGRRLGHLPWMENLLSRLHQCPWKTSCGGSSRGAAALNAEHGRVLAHTCDGTTVSRHRGVKHAQVAYRVSDGGNRAQNAFRRCSWRGMCMGKKCSSTPSATSSSGFRSAPPFLSQPRMHTHTGARMAHSTRSEKRQHQHARPEAHVERQRTAVEQGCEPELVLAHV